jgi:hypothetical protein
VIRAQTSPSHLVFTGEETMPVTSTLHIVTPEEDTPRGVWPIFRIMVCKTRKFGCDVDCSFRISISHEFQRLNLQWNLSLLNCSLLLF